MQKRRPQGDGAVLLGCEHDCPTENRPILQANAAMRTRLNWLLGIHPYGMEVRHV